MLETVLIMGSGPNAVEARKWPKQCFDAIICINNAWQVREDWDYLVYPDDFPADRLPPHPQQEQHLIDETDFVPAQNRFGGFVYAGGTMAYTTAYWALDALRPKQMFFIGCDMHYPKNAQTHFYGNGTADPLRKDITLTSLEASSARLYCLAQQAGCDIYNLSQTQSRLLFTRALIDESGHITLPPDGNRPADTDKMQAILSQEEELGYLVENGRYWESEIKFDEKALCALDSAWLDASPFAFSL